MAGGVRKLDPSILSRPADAPECGAAPMLQWVKVQDLVVDDRYQRPIYGAGVANVRRIVQDFRWSKFAPVIVAPVAGGLFAIIDGQHRATAAAILGFESVPAQIVTADVSEQADAFKSINGQVTRIHSLALHHAGLMAGDARAKAIDAVAVRAGVTILRYPRTADGMAPGDTIALGSVAGAISTYGPDVAVAALRCVTGTRNNRPGALSATTIRALAALLGGNQRWLADPDRLLAA